MARLSDNGTGPRISVIMIFLNGEDFLAEAIDSVLEQSFGDFEFILADDGSGPAAAAIAKGYAAAHPDRVRYIDHDGHANRGMSATRNLGLSIARGEFVAFIDADDVWVPSKLADQIAIMERHSELAMVCGAVNYWRSWNGGVDRVVPTGHRHDGPVRPPEASLQLYPLGRAAAPCPSDLLLRTAVVKRLGGFEQHFTGARMMYEDQGFLAKLYLEEPVYFASQVWLNYRQHPNSIVAEVSRDGRYDEVRRYFLEWFGAYLASKPDADPRVRAAYRRAMWRYRHPRLAPLLDSGIAAARYGKRRIRRLARALHG